MNRCKDCKQFKSTCTSNNGGAFACENFISKNIKFNVDQLVKCSDDCPYHLYFDGFKKINNICVGEFPYFINGDYYGNDDLLPTFNLGDSVYISNSNIKSCYGKMYSFYGYDETLDMPFIIKTKSGNIYNCRYAKLVSDVKFKKFTDARLVYRYHQNETINFHDVFYNIVGYGKRCDKLVLRNKSGKCIQMDLTTLFKEAIFMNGMPVGEYK